MVKIADGTTQRDKFPLAFHTALGVEPGAYVALVSGKNVCELFVGQMLKVHRRPPIRARTVRTARCRCVLTVLIGMPMVDAISPRSISSWNRSTNAVR